MRKNNNSSATNSANHNCRPRMTEGGRQIKGASPQDVDLPKKTATVQLKCNREKMAYQWRRGVYVGDVAKQYHVPSREADRIIREELFGNAEAAQ